MLNIVGTMRNQFGVLGDARYFHSQGPHPLEDTFGIFAACVMLEHSLNPGINETNVQFGTIWKTRSARTNYSNTTIAEVMESVLVGGLKGSQFHLAEPLCMVCGSIGTRTDAVLEWETTLAQTRQ